MITCKECKYYSDQTCNNPKSPCCEWYRNPDWYCADAESDLPFIITDAIIADTLRAVMLVAIQKIIVEIIRISSESILSGL
jgi:hypothetical protein